MLEAGGSDVEELVLALGELRPVHLRDLGDERLDGSQGLREGFDFGGGDRGGGVVCHGVILQICDRAGDWVGGVDGGSGGGGWWDGLLRLLID